jgi:hypothetical protein
MYRKHKEMCYTVICKGRRNWTEGIFDNRRNREDRCKIRKKWGKISKCVGTYKDIWKSSHIKR